MDGIFSSWGRILGGYSPSLSIEITRECPLRCPGCYAYGDDHLGGVTTLRALRDFKGQALIDGVHALVDRHKPLHVSIVGGEPLVRYRELNELLPQLSARGLHVQVVTSAVRPIPEEWAVDPAAVGGGVHRRPARRARRAPGAGHLRPDPQAHRRAADRRALHGDAAAGAAQRIPRGVRAVLAGPAALPQDLVQPVHAADRRGVGREAPTRRTGARSSRRCWRCAGATARSQMPKGMIEVYPDAAAHRPTSASSRGSRTSVSADLETRITPCQFGGRPDCENCGCIASAGLGAVGRLPPGRSAARRPRVQRLACRRLGGPQRPSTAGRLPARRRATTGLLRRPLSGDSSTMRRRVLMLVCLLSLPASLWAAIASRSPTRPTR